VTVSRRKRPIRPLAAALFFALAMMGPIGAPVVAQEGPEPVLTCLLYHRFVTSAEYQRIRGDERIYSMPVNSFEQQLRRLKELGYRSITADEAVAFARGEKRWAQPIVLITIDDGCRSTLTRAEPLLRKYGFHAVFFVTVDPTSYVFDLGGDDQERVSNESLRALDPKVIEVQSHGLTHRPLSLLSDGEIIVELQRSRAALERITGRPVRHLAIPGNWYDARVLRMAKAIGYEGVFVSDRDRVRPGSDTSRLGRFNISGATSPEAFDAILCGRDASRRSVQPRN
jgi:peptidoglycan/xylan/chitin deacetylase (PgdA/CDA1 family)